MADLRDLYQETILEHSRRPRGFGPLDGATHQAQGYNPLCGDRVRVFLRLADGKIGDARFQGKGCAISTASASLMIEVLRGRTREEAEQYFETIHRRLTGTEQPEEASLGKLEVLSGVRDFPTRIKCATLAWHTMRAALAGTQGTVTTEE